MDIEVNIYEPLGYRDTARTLSYKQCNDSLDHYSKKIGRTKDDQEQVEWWKERLKFFKDQDDIYHINRHYPYLYRQNGIWYRPYDQES